MYVGAVDEWFDIDLINDASKKLNNYEFVIIGPASADMKSKLKNLERNNVTYIPPIDHNEIPSYLSEASVCMIPFKKTDLTSCILPNKVFEYSAAGKTCILTDFNPSLKDFEDYIVITETNEEFIDQIKKVCKSPTNKDMLIEFSRKYDLSEISKKYRKVLSDFLF